ncbi:MAG TPA: LLM class flavin-dependent oxidoreductase [Myxococcota bacterium]|jgi:alkanesulfonate monooxygenase SsuD/methylene tetrahydromethanopterin reductase-like flavin-dependent oxidoreductase (luciferase family)|nr:LLM class flavin-dependent oxidoreductase [Myxococcota bacterium]
MKHFLFHLMPYRELPADFEQKHESAWVWAPNELFDPERGHRFYNDYIDELAEAEPLGFDGVCINEHHQNVYGLMPSPNVIAAMLVMRTRRIKIAVVGNALPLYNPPTRVAEEIAMLDVISGGRIISGQVIGGGPEYFSFSINPAEARTRFAEAHELILRAWTEPGPFSHYGEHFKLRYVNVFPRPLQKPHPPIWIPGAGSIETMEFVAKRRYAYMGIPYFHIDFFKKNYAMFREICEKEGYRAHPEQMGLLMPIYVAETDARAREQYERHFWYFKNKLIPGLTLSPPGYTSVKSALRIFKSLQDGKTFINHCETWQDVEKGCFAIVGSPETVAEKIIEHCRDIGCGNMLGLFQLGSMPHEMARENARRYAETVMPIVNAALPNSREPMPASIPFPDGRAGA